MDVTKAAPVGAPQRVVAPVWPLLAAPGTGKAGGDTRWRREAWLGEGRVRCLQEVKTNDPCEEIKEVSLAVMERKTWQVPSWLFGQERRCGHSAQSLPCPALLWGHGDTCQESIAALDLLPWREAAPHTASQTARLSSAQHNSTHLSSAWLSSAQSSSVQISPAGLQLPSGAVFAVPAALWGPRDALPRSRARDVLTAGAELGSHSTAELLGRAGREDTEPICSQPWLREQPAVSPCRKRFVSLTNWASRAALLSSSSEEAAA